jgi:hypothetical protein
MGSIFVIIRKRIVRFVIIVFEETRWIWGFLPFDSELFGPPRKFVFSTKEWLESADSGGGDI